MFEWDKGFETGIADIDQQHQELFRIGRDLHHQMESNSGNNISDEILDCLENLAMYTTYHFDTEEALLYQHGYKDCEEHIKEHHRFIDHLEGFDIDHIDHDNQAAVQNIVSFISEWISEHVSKTDCKYAALIREKTETRL